LGFKKAEQGEGRGKLPEQNQKSRVPIELHSRWVYPPDKECSGTAIQRQQQSNPNAPNKPTGEVEASLSEALTRILDLSVTTDHTKNLCCQDIF